MQSGHAFVWLLVVLLQVSSTLAEAAWRSSLYPVDWVPGFTDGQGRFLHDFSYAGYHSGEAPIPSNPPGPLVDVTQAPYNADKTGATDTTDAIQQAIDAIGATGGGIVFLPAGTYRISPRAGKDYALWIRNNGVVLRGAGPDQTFLYNADPVMRLKEVIRVEPATGDWYSPLGGTTINLTQDVQHPTHILPLANVNGLKVGDWIVARADCTDAFIAEHGMTGLWNSNLQGPTFYRRITAINPAQNTVRVDVPLRYYLKTRDNARIYKVAPSLEEVGIEDLAMGMLENSGSGLGDLDYNTPGTAAFAVHAAHLVAFRHALNGWIQRVHSFRPAANQNDWHMVSNGLLVYRSRNITIRDCLMAKPEYRGEGGNGYAYTLAGSDCLFQDCLAERGRHNYDFQRMWTSGNVIHRCTTRDARLPSDYHMHLSMANLVDNMTVDGDFLEAVYRPYGTFPIHGQTTTESVFWNTLGLKAQPLGSSILIKSRQWGWGYVIGTRGSVIGVERGTQDNTAPEDLLEGQGQGDTLEPPSLYLDQLARRNRPSIVHSGILNLTKNSVELQANLMAPQANVSVYWGSNDGGTIKGNWASVQPLGSKTNGIVSTMLAGLQPGTTYFYRFYAVNSYGEAWASATGVFTTTIPPLPRISHTGVSGLTATAADLLANLSGAQASVSVYWGSSDGGRVKANWANVQSLGSQNVGSVSATLNGLEPGTTYFYRFYAANADGENWAEATDTFTTVAPPIISLVSPVTAPAGTSVTIAGTYFSTLPSENIVYFGAVRATVTQASATVLTVVVPVGATYSPVTVNVGGLIGVSPTPFVVTFESNRQINPAAFAGKLDLPAGAGARSLAIGDLTGDGRADVVVANENSHSIGVYRNVSSLGSLSAGSFARTDFATGAGPCAVAVGDLDGDGRLDLAVVNYYSGTVSLFRNTSTGNTISFATKEDLTTGSNPRAVLMGDIDLDGLPDVVVANEGSSTVSVFRNTGNANSFAAKADFIVGKNPSAVAFGDIDGDGKPDVLVANTFNGPGGNTLSILRNTSTRRTIDAASFAPRVNIQTGAAPLDVAVGDLDGDGKLDVAVANSGNSSVTAFHNNSTPGNIDFDSSGVYASGSTTRTLAIGDVDGDGAADLVVANEVSKVTVLQNTRNLTAIAGAGPEPAGPGFGFATPVSYATAANAFGVALADLDRDAKPELIVACTSGSVSILRNRIKADPPGIAWATPADITYGTALSSVQLNATVGIPGNFIYNPGTGSVPLVGSHTLSATFIPYDTATYNVATASVSLNVNASVLTVTANSASRSYGAANPVFTGTITGLRNNDNITASYTSDATPATPAGSYTALNPNAITPTLVDPDNRLGNYSVTVNSGTLSITPAALTVNVNDASRAYSAVDPTFSVTFIGLANNDAIGTTFFPGAAQTDPPGIYALNVILSGTALANYAPNVKPGTLTVTNALLTLTANPASRTYGAANPAFTGTVAGLVGEETVSATFGSTATPASRVGGYPITVTALTGSALAYCTVVTNTALLTINQAALTVTPNSASRVYGAANPAFTGVIAGLQNSDPITANFACAAAPPSPPGDYDITTTLNDPSSKLGNYSISLNMGTLTVTGGDAPVITLSSNLVNYVENAAPVILCGGGTVVDAGSVDFDTGVMTIDFIESGTADDRLAIRHQGTATGQIGVLGTNVTLGGTVIGSYTGGTDGAAPLAITLNANATPTVAQSLMRNLTYYNVSDNPSAEARTLRIVLTDGDGGTSAPVTLNLNVTAVNDAPVVAWGTPANNASLKSPGPIVLLATPTDVDGTITQVEFFAGTTSLGVVTNAPYELSWNNVAVGSYTLRAVATDNSAAKGTNSPAIDVTVYPGFNTSQVNTGGQFKLTFTGMSGVVYDIEMSTDLINWVKIGQATAGTGATPFLDAQQISFISQRFYRLRVHSP